MTVVGETSETELMLKCDVTDIVISLLSYKRAASEPFRFSSESWSMNQWNGGQTFPRSVRCACDWFINSCPRQLTASILSWRVTHIDLIGLWIRWSISKTTAEVVWRICSMFLFGCVSAVSWRFKSLFCHRGLDPISCWALRHAISYLLAIFTLQFSEREAFEQIQDIYIIYLYLPRNDSEFKSCN